MLKAVIFDLDGLMIDSEPLAKRAWELVLSEYDRQLNDDLYEKMVGLRLEDSSLLVSQALDIAVDPAIMARKEKARFELLMADGIPVMPGLIELISKINDRKIPWAVATSSQLSYAQKVLDNIGLLESCQAIASGEEVARGKPYPDVYLLASQRVGVGARKCLALEDSIPGCQSASAAGMVTVAIPPETANGQEYSCAQYIFPSLVDVALELDLILAPPTQ